MLDGFDEIEHRDARNDKRRRLCHRLFDGGDRAAQSGELLVGLYPAQLVDDARARREAFEPDDPAEVERRLGPDPVTDRDVHAHAARDSLEGSEAVVGLGHHDDLAGRLLVQVEQREHPR